MTNDTTGRPVPEDPWVDITPQRPGDPAGPQEPAAAWASPAPAPAPESRARGASKVVGLFAAGAVAGALVVGALNGFGTPGSDAAQPVAQNSQVAGVPPGGSTQGQQGQQGLGPGALAGVGGGRGGTAGEQRIEGTVSAVSGSSLTVRTASGIVTYTIVAQTQIVRGNALADASAIKTGDTVLVHVFPAQGSGGVLERVFVLGSSTGTPTGTTSDDDGSTT